MRMLSDLVVSAVGLSLLVGCSSGSRGFCEASADCDAEIPFTDFDFDAAGDADDSVAVCSANQDAILRSLRANEEEECRAVADALDAYFACVAAEFADGGDGCDAVNDECKSELDDVQDAQADVNGNECTANED